MATTLAGAGSRLWAPARLRSFRLLWAGQALSLLGDGFSYIAFAWITLELTGSTLMLGYVLAAQAVPRALLTLVGGSLSDRWSPRRLMVMSSWARAGVMAGVAAAGFSGTLGFWTLCTAAAAFGAVDAFFQPARVSILPSVVAADVLPAANALLGSGVKVASVLGPAVGGVVVAATDANYAFLVDALCFALCALCVSAVRTLPREQEEDAGGGTEVGDSLWARIKEGLRYVWVDPRIRTVIVVDMAVTFCYAGPFTVGFANLARNEVEGGSATMGLLNGALAAGAMLGTLVGGAVGTRPRVGLLVAALAGWLAVGMAALGTVDQAAVAVGTVLAMGFGIGFQGVFGVSWIQRNIKGSVLSRVISVDMVLGYAVAPLSLVVSGALAERNTAVMFGGTAVILAVTALGVLSSKPVREMR